MCGNKVLQNGQPFTKIGRNRRFNDLAGWFGHEPTHTGQLPHLILAAPGTGIRHHINWIQAFRDNRFLVLIQHRVSVFIDNGGNLHGVHHLVGNIIRCLGPYIDNLVVLFTLGNETLGVLPADFLNPRLRGLENVPLGIWNNHGIDGNGQASLGGILVADVLQSVCQDNGGLRSQVPVGIVNDFSELALVHDLVDNVKWYFRPFFDNFEQVKQQIVGHDNAADFA